MSKKILVAEDEKPMANALAMKLSRAGFEVVNAYNGEECVDYFNKEKFDLVLLDLIMPKLDGFKVLEKIKETGSATPVIILSNLSQEDDEKKARSLGAVDFFIKSNTPIVNIINKVQEFLN
jgi:DNA-binding response OmpR family regulator